LTLLPGWLMDRNSGRYDRKRQALVFPVGPGLNRHRTQRDEAQLRGIAVDQEAMNGWVRKKQAKR
jgi:hypothetical protein